MPEMYDINVHTQYAVLDIGEDIGALVISTPQAFHGREIEVSLRGYDTRRIHTAVLERQVNGRTVFAALFLSLPTGDYKIWCNDPRAPQSVKINGGEVAEIDWRGGEGALALPSWYPLRHAGGSSIPEHIRRMLPPRYQNGKPVSSAPMRSAPMRYTEDGQVAWNEMWTTFCDLALAGGPAHRDTLLDSPSLEEIAANPADYQRVVAEIQRGLYMVTGSPIALSDRPGWVALQCENKDMAYWLQQAIAVENVNVHREQTLLFLPAGPAFSIDKEIKNIVTVVAKTHHYWMEHLFS